jgi:hypothetical protein
MQLTATQTFLLLLPLATAISTTTTTATTTTTIATTKASNGADVDINPRGVVDSVKGFFGDPVAKVNELSDCMAACAGFTALFIGINEDCDPVRDGVMNCMCNHARGFTDQGAAWTNKTKTCLAGEEGKEYPAEGWYMRLGCNTPDAFEDGKLVDICKAADGEDLVKQNETVQAIVSNMETALGWDKEEEGAEGEGAEGKAAAGNGTSKESGAAAAAAGAGAVARITGAVLAVAVGYAFAML